MSTDDDGKSLPKSMRHRQILDVAEEHPDSPIDELASMVPSASPELVERVLDEHGDPAADAAEPSPAADTASTPDDEPTSNSPETDPDESGTDAAKTPEPADADSTADDPEPVTLESLSEKQRAVLELVARHPDATQQEIGDELDVSSATISNRVNDIEGFDWSQRASYVAELFDEDPPSESVLADGTTDRADEDRRDASDGDRTAEPDDGPTENGLDTRLARLEARLEDLESAEAGEGSDRDAPFEDPELVHKIVHACMNSDEITESEELRILEGLLT